MKSQLPKTLVSDDAAYGTKSSGGVVALDDDVSLSRRALLLGILAGGLGLAIRVR